MCGWFSGNVTTTQGHVRKTQQARPTISLRDDEDELVVHAKPMEYLSYERVQVRRKASLGLCMSAGISWCLQLSQPHEITNSFAINQYCRPCWTQ